MLTDALQLPLCWMKMRHCTITMSKTHLKPKLVISCVKLRFHCVEKNFCSCSLTSSYKRKRGLSTSLYLSF